MAKVLIIGGGQGGAQCAATLRQKGWTDEIVIAGDESAAPYQRPPLSKAYLAGDLAGERLSLKPTAFYEKENIELKLGVRATKIDRAGKQVTFDDGTVVAYDKLVLATGARIRKLPIPGADLDGVGYVRSIADVDALKSRFAAGGALAIVGAGYIGLEVAAVAAKHGLKVTVLEAEDRVMARVTSPTVSAFFQRLHGERGVDIRLNAKAKAFKGENGAVTGIELADGDVIPCDFSIVGVGVIPNTDIAEDAGIEAKDGIVVDEFTRTTDPDIFAVGDCTRHPSQYFGAPIRLESVHNAIEQGKTAAMAICGDEKPYDQAPWFWSDQYEIKLQTVGLRDDRVTEEVVRGAPAENKFSVFYLADGHIRAVDSINAPADHMIARRLIAGNVSVDSAQLQDPEFDLKALL